MLESADECRKSRSGNPYGPSRSGARLAIRDAAGFLEALHLAVCPDESDFGPTKNKFDRKTLQQIAFSCHASQNGQLDLRGTRDTERSTIDVGSAWGRCEKCRGAVRYSTERRAARDSNKKANCIGTAEFWCLARSAFRQHACIAEPVRNTERTLRGHADAAPYKICELLGCHAAIHWSLSPGWV